MSREFDWDRFVGTASFAQIRELSPELSNRRIPTLYSPDREWIYISTLDTDCRTGDAELLKQMLHGVISAYQETASSDQRRAVAWRDGIEICGLLQACDSDPDHYAHPESLLNPAEE